MGATDVDSIGTIPKELSVQRFKKSRSIKRRKKNQGITNIIHAKTINGTASRHISSHATVQGPLPKLPTALNV